MKPLKVLAWLSLAFGLVLLVLLFSGNVGAWSTTTFNNSLSSENVTLTGDNIPFWTSSTGNRTYPFTYSYDYNYNTYTEMNHGAIVYYNFTNSASSITIKMILSGDGSDALACFDGTNWNTVSISSFDNVFVSEHTLNLPSICQSVPTKLKFTGGSLSFQYMKVYELNQGVRGIRYLSIPSSVSAVTTAQMNLSGYEIRPGNTSCYQETADTATACGGLSTGSYSYEQNRYSGYYYINYSKPIGSTGIKWMVRHGDSTKSTYNVTISYSCFAYQSDKISLRFFTYGNSGSIGTSYGQCLSNSGWQTITNTYTGWHTSGWCHSEPPTFFTDGDWNTLNHFYVVFPGTDSEAFYWGYSGCSADTSGANLYEEAVIWDYGVLSNNSLFVGNSQVWNYLGTFNQTNNRTNNFATYINNYLSTCSYVSGYCNVPFLFHSDTAGILGYSDMSFNNLGFIENSQTYNAQTYETKAETFTINITYDGGTYTGSNGYLIYNGTSYAGTKTGSGNNFIFTKSVSMPDTNGTDTNMSFYWQLALTNSSGTNYFNSTNHSQEIRPVQFSICSATNPVIFLNMTFKEESLLATPINATIISSWIYSVNGGATTKSYSFTNLTANYEYDFCFSPADVYISATPTITYVNPTSYQRTYSNTGLIFTNASYPLTLWLLPTGYGALVTFQVVNRAAQPISGATVTASSSGGLVQSGVTDDSGAVVFFLSPSTTYDLLASKTGYTSDSKSITPSQSGYTLTLGGTGSTTPAESDYLKGITYSVSPPSQTLVNNTDYTFSFTLASSFWSMDSFGFVLTNGSDVLGSSSAFTASGGTVSVLQNTVNNSKIQMNYYWVINGTYMNATTYWSVRNNAGGGWSISNFFTDLKTYTSQGIFGLTNFGLTIFIFLIIFGITGIMSYKFSITSPTAILVIAFALVAFFDVGLGMITSPIGAVSNFPTIIMGVILVMSAIREGMRW